MTDHSQLPQMVKKSSSMKFLAILYFLFLLAFIVLIKISSFKTIPTIEIRQKTKEVTILNQKSDLDMFLGNNVSAPYIHCAKGNKNSFYEEKYFSLSGLENSILKQKISDDKSKGNTILPSLLLEEDGSFSYLLNGKAVWSSKTPRSFLDCFELKLLRSTVFKDLKANNDSNHPFLDDWPYVFKNDTDFRLHIMPLCITYASKASGGVRDASKRRLAWTFLSGWDATATACNSLSCKIPLPMVDPPLELNDSSNKGKIFMKNNAFYLSLFNNGDLVVVKKENVSLQKNDEDELELKNNFEIHCSLMEKYCL